MADSIIEFSNNILFGAILIYASSSMITVISVYA
jgi:hypothetical protein